MPGRESSEERILSYNIGLGLHDAVFAAKIYNKLKSDGYEDETIRKIIIKEELGKLEEKEKQIILDRFFYDKTQMEIAEKMKISQVQVSRLEKKILAKLRNNIKEKL